MIKVSFFISSTKPNKYGKSRLYARIKKSETDYADIYTKISVDPSDWSGSRIKETDLFHLHYNVMLDTLKADLIEHCIVHKEQSAAMIKQLYLNKLKKKYSVGELVKKYVESKLFEKDDDGENVTKNKETRRTYKTHLRALTAFLELAQLYHVDASTFAFPEGRILYQRILKAKKSTIYSNKLMRLLKASFQYGLGERLITTNHMEGFKLKSVKKKQLTSKDFLTLDEIVRLINIEVPEQYNIAKILATRQIFTGMAFVDALGFNPASITTQDNQKTIIAKRSKTGEEFIVPLNLIAEAVCIGYDWQGKKIANCTYNAHLKVLAAYAGITKNVTTHMLRRTFGQNMLNSGISEEVVAKMMGHVDTRMLKFYTVISQTRVLDEYNQRIAA